jgi:hypothetical protein
VQILLERYLYSGHIFSCNMADANATKSDFEYHDNKVYFIVKPVNDETITVKSGTYKVNELCITSGQDPKHKNKKGDVKKINTGDNNSITFEVGRKNSKEVAQWWNDRVKSDQNTFDHTAGDLNFAFMGTLQLHVNDSNQGDLQVTFENIGLAQGFDRPNNNWWFGGPNCTFEDNLDHTVKAQGKANGGGDYYFYFKRGAQGPLHVDEVTLLGITNN